MDAYSCLRWGAAALSILLSAGCAQNLAKLPPELNPPLERQSVALPQGAVISIEYPMMGTPAARQRLVSSYACAYNAFIGHPLSSCGNSHFSGDQAPLLFDQSTYYAAELRRIFGRYMDESAVRLEPLLIDYRDGEFVTTRLLPDRSPSVMVIAVYDFPSSVTSVVGSGYNPRVNIRSAAQVSPETCGNLLASPGHIGFDEGQVAQCAGRDARAAPAFQLLSYFAEKKTTLVLLPKQDGKQVNPGTLYAGKHLWERNDEPYLNASAKPDFKATADSIKNTTSDWIARIALDALSRTDVAVAYDAGFAVYAQDYDPALADRLRERRTEPADARKVEILRKLLVAEEDWLAAQNEAITEGILNGGYGRSFRQSRVVLAEAYRKSQNAGWLQVGATLMSGFSSGLFAGGAAYNPTALATQTVQNENQYRQSLAQIQNAAASALAPAAAMREHVVQVSIDGVKAKIQGENADDIRAQLKKLYRKLARA